MSRELAIELMERARQEASQFHRYKHYLEWKADAAQVLGQRLLATEPFKPVQGLAVVASDRFRPLRAEEIGEWALNQTGRDGSATAALDHLELELQRNQARYDEIRLIEGLEIDGPCVLDDGVEVVASTAPKSLTGEDTAFGPATLRQGFLVEPAFTYDESQPAPLQEGSPSPDARSAALPLVLYAALLEASCPISFSRSRIAPSSRSLLVTLPPQRDLLTSKVGTWSRVSAIRLKDTYDRLKAFPKPDPLFRAIERLGRSRQAVDEADRALDLGIAAEIAMTHDDSGTSEITYRLASRLAWLLGASAQERLTIFAEAKLLYQARSTAAHKGQWSAKSKLDLDAGDRLVTRALRAILYRAAFPDWTALILGVAQPGSEVVTLIK